MKKRNLIMLGIMAAGTAVFGDAFTNDASIANSDWLDLDLNMALTDGTATNRVGYTLRSGTGGGAPSVTNSVLSVSMVGASAGLSDLRTDSLNTYIFNTATNYIVTTRMKVTQFPDTAMSSGMGNLDAGIAFFDIRGIDRAFIRLEATGVWVKQAAGWAKTDVATALDTYYTWQFEVHQLKGTGIGVVDIFRRVSDASAWMTVALDVPILSQDTVDQLILFRVFYNPDNSQIQGSVDVDYFKLGFTPERVSPHPPYAVWMESDWSSADVFWASSTNKVGWNLFAGTGGLSPLFKNKEVKMSMMGATEGKTMLQSGGLAGFDFATTTNYIVTTRMKVTQFPDSTVSSNNIDNTGLNICDIRGGFDRLRVHLEPDGIWVQKGGGWKFAASIATAENTYYTWKFEVRQLDPGVGTVDIFRRESDSDLWTTVVTNEFLADQHFTPQILIGPVFYNSENTGLQGAMVSDYFWMGPLPTSVETPYGAWAASYGLTGNNALLDADVEPDGLDNLTEYALGGNPTNSDASAVLPTSGTVAEGGTNWLEYVYHRRVDYEARGLGYTLKTSDDLAYGTWTNGNYIVDGVGNVDASFEAVTNRVDTGVVNERFIQLYIQQN